MGTRILAPIVLVASGCGLVSGLDSLTVGDASTDGSIDASSIDAASDVSNDAIQTEAAPPGRAGHALQTSGGCANASGALSESNVVFSVAMWLRVDVAPSSNELYGVVWNGGRSSAEPGWSIDVGAKGVIFCVADQNGNTCTPAYAITTGDLVHLVATSPYTGQTSGRTLNLYARNFTKHDVTHTLVATMSGAQGNWTTGAQFTVGGTYVNQGCLTSPSITIDDLWVLSFVPTIATMDNTMSTDVCGSAGLVIDYKFDEGSGTTAGDCDGKSPLTLGSNTAFVVSPFP